MSWGSLFPEYNRDIVLPQRPLVNYSDLDESVELSSEDGMGPEVSANSVGTLGTANSSGLGF